MGHVIQDLPYELLRRILALAATNIDGKVDKASIRHAALVSREWRHPAQSVLLDQGVFLGMEQHSKRLLELEAPLAIGRLSLSDKKNLELLRPKLSHVGILLLGGEFAIEDSDLPMLSMARSLIFHGRHHGDLSPISAGLDDLRHLELPGGGVSPTVANPLLNAAHALTSLAFFWNPSSTLLPGLLKVAPQLQRLSLLQPGISPSSSDLKLLDFVPFCTSLKSLVLLMVEEKDLVPIIGLVQSSLVFLETDELKPNPFPADIVIHHPRPHLLAALDLPCMRALKRWRLIWSTRYTRQEERPYIVAGEQIWQETCRARGVELRDGRRYFTD